MGVARGVFSNESGLGSAPIVPPRRAPPSRSAQGLVSMTQTFIDTIVVCTMTGAGHPGDRRLGLGETGGTLTTNAFSTGLPGDWAARRRSCRLMLFAYTTCSAGATTARRAGSTCSGARW
jgi:alanine or glycine:cation symporter, AGCS family